MFCLVARIEKRGELVSLFMRILMKSRSEYLPFALLRTFDMAIAAFHVIFGDLLVKWVINTVLKAATMQSFPCTVNRRGSQFLLIGFPYNYYPLMKGITFSDKKPMSISPRK
jgi:hypothetical protein